MLHHEEKKSTKRDGKREFFLREGRYPLVQSWAALSLALIALATLSGSVSVSESVSNVPAWSLSGNHAPDCKVDPDLRYRYRCRRRLGCGPSPFVMANVSGQARGAVHRLPEPIVVALFLEHLEQDVKNAERLHRGKLPQPLHESGLVYGADLI